MVSTLFRRTLDEVSWESEKSSSRSSVPRVWCERWSYSVRRAPAGGCCGCDGAVGAGRKSNRRSKTNEKERICMFYFSFFTPIFGIWTYHLRVCCDCKLGKGEQVELRGVREPLIDCFLRTFVIFCQIQGLEIGQSKYLDRISLSPNTRFDRICVSSAVICGGTTLSMIQYQYVVLFRTVTAEMRRAFKKQKKAGGDDGYMNGNTARHPRCYHFRLSPQIPVTILRVLDDHGCQ